METLSKVFEDKYNKNVKDCTNEEIYHGLLSWTKEQLKGRGYQDGKKKIYYISAEFLIGKLLSNNLINLGVYDEVAKYLKENGKELSMIEEIEPEPSLGNGGLGRLAACFLDSIATLGLPGEGIGLNYHLGLFKQEFKNNLQRETPNPWIEEKYIKAAGIDMEKSLKLATPPAPDLAYLRSSLIPGMLEAVAKNLRYYDEFRLFDCEEVYEKGDYRPSSEDEILPIQKNYLTGCIVGKDAKEIFYEAKGVIENMAEYCHMEELKLEKIEKPYWADVNAYLNVVKGNEVIGTLGLVSVKVMTDTKIKRTNVAMFEINTDKFVPYASRTNEYERLPELPLVEKDLSIIVDEMVSKIPGFILNSSERYKYLAYRLKKMLISAINIISMQIKQGNFEPVDYEVSFRKNGKYPPIKLTLNNGEEITLVGQIDRIDELEKDDSKYIRIVDYKSGDKSINLTEVYYGLQLQLLVYLDAIIESDKYKKSTLKPAAILYNRIDNPIVKSNEDQKDSIINEEILKKLRMNGLVLKDKDIIGEMDLSLKEGDRKTSLVIPANFDKNGNIGRYTKGVTDEEFDILREYVKYEVKELCERMVGGDISIIPCKNKNGTSCDFCSYASICQFDVSIKGNTYTVLNDKSDEEVIKLMEKEVKK